MSRFEIKIEYDIPQMWSFEDGYIHELKLPEQHEVEQASTEYIENDIDAISKWMAVAAPLFVGTLEYSYLSKLYLLLQTVVLNRKRRFNLRFDPCLKNTSIKFVVGDKMSTVENFILKFSEVVREFIEADLEWSSSLYRVTYYRDDEDGVAVSHTVGFVPAECLSAVVTAHRTSEFRLLSVEWMGM